MNLETIAVIGWSLVIISMLAFIIKVAYNTIKAEKEEEKQPQYKPKSKKKKKKKNF